MTVNELGERMTSRELTEWIALLQVEPWGPYRDDYLSAVQAWASVAPWSKEVKISDFIRDWGSPPKEQGKALTVEEARATLLALGAREVLNG